MCHSPHIRRLVHIPYVNETLVSRLGMQMYNNCINILFVLSIYHYSVIITKMTE